MFDSEVFKYAYPFAQALLHGSGPVGARMGQGLHSGLRMSDYFSQRQEQKTKDKKMADMLPELYGMKETKRTELPQIETEPGDAPVGTRPEFTEKNIFSPEQVRLGQVLAESGHGSEAAGYAMELLKKREGRKPPMDEVLGQFASQLPAGVSVTQEFDGGQVTRKAPEALKPNWQHVQKNIGDFAVSYAFNPATREYKEIGREKIGAAPSRDKDPLDEEYKRSQIERNRRPERGPQPPQMHPLTAENIRDQIEDRKTRREQGDKPMTRAEKLRAVASIRGEARRLIEAQFRGVMGQIDMSSLGKTPEARQAAFNGLVNRQVQELATERGLSLEELQGTTGVSGAPSEQAQPPQAAPAGAMSQMPPADKHGGRRVRDTQSGILYKSDGKKWLEVNEY
jgi:hypothetical protein